MAIPSHHHKKPDLARLMSSTWVPNPHQATRPRWLTWPNLPARIPSPARWREPHAAPADLARNEAEILSTWPAVTAPPPPPSRATSPARTSVDQVTDSDAQLPVYVDRQMGGVVALVDRVHGSRGGWRGVDPAICSRYSVAGLPAIQLQKSAPHESPNKMKTRVTCVDMVMVCHIYLPYQRQWLMIWWAMSI